MYTVASYSLTVDVMKFEVCSRVFAYLDENNGWAYKTIDYIVFPVGLLALGPSLLITLGRNVPASAFDAIDTHGNCRLCHCIHTVLP